jgi:sarcosine oxidase subunit beta
VLTAWEAAPAWERWEDHLGVRDPDGMCRFIRTGVLLFDTPDYSRTRFTDLWDDVGIPYEVLSPDEIRRRHPGIDIGVYFPPKPVDDPACADDAHGELTAVFEPNGGFIDDPALAARNLAFAARHHGATFRFHAEVVEVVRDDEGVRGVRLADGETIQAHVVVNVGGPHSARSNAMAGVVDDMRIHSRPLRQEVCAAPAPAGLDIDHGPPLVSDLDLGQYFRPQVGGTLLVGGTEPACDELEWVDDPDHFDEHTTVEKFETTMSRLARRVREFGVPHRPMDLAALYDVADDWVPIYDRSSLGGLVHGVCHQRQPVQERPDRRPLHAAPSWADRATVTCAAGPSQLVAISASGGVRCASTRRALGSSTVSTQARASAGERPWCSWRATRRSMRTSSGTSAHQHSSSSGRTRRQGSTSRRR